MKKLFIILSFLPLFLSGQYQTTNLDFLFNSSITVNGSDTLLVDSITGTFDTDYVLTFVDFDITLGYLPGKTAAKLNGQPICTFFQNANYADTSFVQWLDHELNADSTENKSFRIKRIAHYSTPTTDVNDFFQTPIKSTVNFTEVGVGKTYSTISAAITGSSIADTIYVYDGDYNETNFLNWRLQDIISVGDCKITSTGTSYVVRSELEFDALLSGFEIDGEGNTINCLAGITTYNNKYVRNCFFTGSSADLVNFRTTSILTPNYILSRCAASNENEIDLGVELEVSELYLNNTPFRIGNPIDTMKISYCDFKSSLAGEILLILDVNSSNTIVNFNNFKDISATKMLSSLTPGGELFEFRKNNITTDSIFTSSLSVDNYQNIIISNNVFTNKNKFSLKPNILITDFNTAYITDNIFNTRPESGIFAININSTTNQGTLYFEGNVDSSYSPSGYFARIGSETSGIYDNKIDKLYLRNNIGYGLKYFYPDTSDVTIHGLFVGFESGEQIITRNNINGYGINYVFEGSTGTISKDTKIWSNLSSNCYAYGFYAKGLDSINYYNNTSYNDSIAYFFSANTGGDYADNCSVINSAIDTKINGTAYVFSTFNDDEFTSSNNVVYSDNIAYYLSASRNWSEWQGLGQGVNSSNTDPLLDINLCPASNSDAVFNGLNLGSPYDIGLVCGTSTTRNQTTPYYTIGAIVIDKPIDSVGRFGNGLWGFGTGTVGY